MPPDEKTHHSLAKNIEHDSDGCCRSSYQFARNTGDGEHTGLHVSI